MACPFLDPSMLARLPAEKREEMKEMYHRMKKEQNEHLKIDIKEDEIDNVSSPEQMMMGMTGGSSSVTPAGMMMSMDDDSNSMMNMMGGNSGGSSSGGIAKCPASGSTAGACPVMGL